MQFVTPSHQRNLVKRLRLCRIRRPVHRFTERLGLLLDLFDERLKRSACGTVPFTSVSAEATKFCSKLRYNSARMPEGRTREARNSGPACAHR